MAIGSALRRRHDRPDPGERKARETRSAVQTETTDNPYASITVNITQSGAVKHDIRAGDRVEVQVCENGIWIEPAENGADGQR